ncbi:protein of unknown function [Denitratisoma oestradiolicum]|uniref:Uncharacterized protein n=1 Tax=Denitratisoma oestradiolicum TaxID=311182 RepID=A0A6S6Y4M7_9PROT|nr:protein of unknown function [Denitratisoma oestradiolicum]
MIENTRRLPVVETKAALYREKASTKPSVTIERSEPMSSPALGRGWDALLGRISFSGGGW